MTSSTITPSSNSPSVLQERFWLFDRLAPRASVHVGALAAWSDGRVEPRTVEQALAAVVTRHDVLRMRFVAADGSPCIRLLDTSDVTVDVAQAESRAEAFAFAMRAATEPFDLESGPLIKVCLVRTPVGSLVVLAAHRIVADRASLRTLIAELGHVERRLTTGEKPALSLPAIQFHDAAPKEVARSDDPSVGALRDELRGAPLDIALPTVRRHEAERGYRGARCKATLPAELLRSARALAELEDVPVDAVLLAAFQALLHRYSRQAGLIVGVELDRRPCADAVGPYADLVPVCSQVAEATTFRTMVEAAGRALARAASRPVIPLGLIAGSLGAGLTVKRRGLCQVAFGVHHAPPAQAGWKLETLDRGATEFELEVVVITEPDADCAVELVYDVELFEPDRVFAFARHYERLLAAAVADPNTRVSRLEFLSDDDLQKLLVEFTGYPEVAPIDRPVHMLIEEQAARAPDAVAVAAADERLTYRELNGLANQVARELRARGLRKGTVVAVCFDRSSEWLVALLGCFKIGVVPVLLDVRAPVERLKLALETVRVELVLGLERLQTAIPLGADRLIYFDRDRSLLERHDSSDLGEAIALDHLAYIVQTSGSSGTPKAMAWQHGVLSHCCIQAAIVNRLSARDRGTWLAPASAGVSCLETWPFLCVGASIHAPERDIVTDPMRLRDWLLDERITQSLVVPGIGEALVQMQWPDDAALELLLMATEQVRRWAPATLPFEVGVAYGSSEALMMSSPLHPWEKRLTSATATTDDRRDPPPIGRSWPGIRLYVLDEDLNMMPIGAVGEICVDSPELTIGYLGDSAQTAEKFRPNPFPSAPGSRLYRTGDLARFRDNGVIEFRGRADTQVKIHGCRVELSEVEETLLEHPKVADCAVAAVPDQEGRDRLVAYVVPRAPVAPIELRDALATRLPDYMVPAAYVLVDALPRGTTHKVDRSSLPVPDWSTARARRTYAPPRSDAERKLVEIWAALLDVSEVGVDDDFFELGGDSLLASRMLVHARDALGVDITLRDLFLGPTPTGLAAAAEAAGGRTARRALPQVLARRR